MINYMKRSYPCALNQLLFAVIFGCAIIAGMLKHEVSKHAACHHTAERH